MLVVVVLLFSRGCHVLPQWDVSLISRDVIALAVVDAATCLLAGFAIFSILGYLALGQGKDVSEVVKEGEKGLRELTQLPPTFGILINVHSRGLTAHMISLGSVCLYVC